MAVDVIDLVTSSDDEVTMIEVRKASVVRQEKGKARVRDLATAEVNGIRGVSLNGTAQLPLRRSEPPKPARPSMVDAALANPTRKTTLTTEQNGREDLGSSGPERASAPIMPRKLPLARRSGGAEQEERARRAAEFCNREALKAVHSNAGAERIIAQGQERSPGTPKVAREASQRGQENYTSEPPNKRRRIHTPLKAAVPQGSSWPPSFPAATLARNIKSSNDTQDVLDEVPAKSGNAVSRDESFTQPSLGRAREGYTPQDDAKIESLRRNGIKWRAIHQHFPTRSIVSLRDRLKYARKKRNSRQCTTTLSVPERHASSAAIADSDSVVNESKVGSSVMGPPASLLQEQIPVRAGFEDSVSAANKDVTMVESERIVPVQSDSPHLMFEGPTTGFNTRYSPEEDAHLIRLREVHSIAWPEMPKYFKGRTQGSLQVRYSGIRNKPEDSTAHSPIASGSSTADADTRPKRQCKSKVRAGFVSWADVKAKRLVDDSHLKASCTVHAADHSDTANEAIASQGDLALKRAAPLLNRMLRARETSWVSRAKISADLRNSILDTLGPRRMFNGTSGDVTCVAWAKDRNQFAAGSIAISDTDSIHYNRPYNLLLGNVNTNSLLELPEHHVTRPVVAAQDPRVFKTVAAVEFDSDSHLFTAGGDGLVHMYDVRTGRCLDSFDHGATVDMLSLTAPGVLASTRHKSDNSITLSKYDSETFVDHIELALPKASTASHVYPSALKSHNGFLLAGFASDDERLAAGGVGLWDTRTGQLIATPSVSRGVFDVAWNLFAGRGSTLFAAAISKSESRIRSSVQCFANSNGIRKVLDLDCPALDINDVLYCPHDDNLIAAGATDGKVYIWDKRYASDKQSPLHVLRHEHSRNVLDHQRHREVTDTGVRFLSWSATCNRLYSGSSDGVVKIWDPYKSNPFVKDVARFESAIMSGAFSPDFRDLIIGEERGQINLMGIDRAGRSTRAAKRFDLHTAPSPVTAPTLDADVSMGGVSLAGKIDTVDEAMAQCKLDCGFTATAADEKGEMPDNRVAEQRIPGVMRKWVQPHEWLRRASPADLTNAEIHDAGLTSKCAFCTGPAEPSSQTLPQCETCTLKGNGLTVRCSRCSYPIRPDSETGRETRLVCQRCDFRCFRCNGQAIVAIDGDGDTVRCVPCGVIWDAGVLGYEVRSPIVANERAKPRVKRKEDSERLRMAEGWLVPWVDRPRVYNDGTGEMLHR